MDQTKGTRMSRDAHELQARGLDHVALRVHDRDSLAAELGERTEMRVIERTDRFTLVGVDDDAGKLTLLDAEPDSRPRVGRLVSVLLAEIDGQVVREPITTACGLVLTFAMPRQLAGIPRHAVAGVALRTADPVVSAAAWAQRHGLTPRSCSREVATLGFAPEPIGDGAMLTLLHERSTDDDGAALLDHVGVLVDALDPWLDQTRDDGIELIDVVEASRSRAAFVRGPDGVVVEYIERVPALERA